MEEQQAAAPDNVQISDEQIMNIKHALINQILQIYTKFISELRKLPAAPFQRQQAFISFDDGMLWMKEAIAAAKLEVKSVSQSEIPPQGEPVEQDQVAQNGQDDAMCEAPVNP